MKKQITITLEVEDADESFMSDDFIKNDLECEIACCSNSYEIKDIQAMQDLEQAQLDKAYELGKAEAERTGEWIIQDGKVVCSECFEQNRETNFCPHCGARMVKE